MIKKILSYIDKTNRAVNKINIINREILYSLAFKELDEKNVTSKDTITSCDDYEVEGELIVTLTTYGNRINQVYLTIESIASQSWKPNKIILWLDENEFSNDNLPLSLVKLQNRGLIIRFYENIRSYKKIIPALKFYPNDTLITIDDDIIYAKDMIENLVLDSLKYPKQIIGYRAHKITFKNSNVNKYKDWDFECSSFYLDRNTFLTTGAGTLFPPKLFNEEIMNEQVFMKICPYADDIWIYLMAVNSNINCRKVRDSREYWDRFLIMNNAQDNGLYVKNIESGQNDVQFSKVQSYYNIELDVV